MARKWTYSAGEYGCKVTVYQSDAKSKIIHLEGPDGRGGRKYYRSLKHSNRERAKDEAKVTAAALAAGKNTLLDPTPTVQRVFGLYLCHHSPRNSESQQHAKQSAAAWKRFLGKTFDLRKLTKQRWLEFIGLRQSGAIDCRGNPIKDG